jgi:colanic acid biosynthesis glycosyl transferase WcaI
MRRLTMLLPHYPPDVAADGQLFSLLAHELSARGMRVTVLTWRPRYQGKAGNAPRSERRDGVTVRRMWAPAMGKALPFRALAAAWVTATALLRAMFSRGTLLMPSSPPTLSAVGWLLSWLGRRYVYVLHDLHPQLGLALGRIKPGMAAGLLRFVQRSALSRGVTVTLTDGMAERARGLQPRARVRVIPNWVDTRAIQPRPKAESRFARRHGLIEPFVVQYSGNLGLLHPLDGLTLSMKELPDVVLVYIGRGARLEATKAAAAGLNSVQFHDYQPFENLADSLAACDLAVVALEPGADGLAMPSKVQGILASGRPILALAPESSELARLVTECGAGWVEADFQDAQAVARAISAIKADAPGRARRAQAARACAEARFSVQAAADAYQRLLEEAG